MDSRFPHTLAKRNVIGYKERFMDVEDRSVWTSVLMVLIARRCVNTSRGPKAPMEAFCPHTPMEAFCPHTPFHGRGSECLTNIPFCGDRMSSWERGVGTLASPPSQTYHSVGTECLHGRGVWGRNVSTGVWGNARLRRAVSPLSRQKATPLAHHTREAYYRFPHTHRRWTANT